MSKILEDLKFFRSYLERFQMPLGRTTKFSLETFKNFDERPQRLQKLLSIDCRIFCRDLQWKIWKITPWKQQFCLLGHCISHKLWPNVLSLASLLSHHSPLQFSRHFSFFSSLTSNLWLPLDMECFEIKRATNGCCGTCGKFQRREIKKKHLQIFRFSSQ